MAALRVQTAMAAVAAHPKTHADVERF